MSDAPRRNRLLAILWQICRAFGWCAIVTASLLVFPSGIPWLVAGWLAAYTLLARSRRHGLVCLGVCAAILVAKGLTPAPGLLAFLAVMLVVIGVGVVHVRRRAEQRPSWRFAWLSSVVLWIAWCGMAADWIRAAHIRHSVALKGDRPIVCLGDSMTSLRAFGGYPQQLQKLVSLSVRDEGTPGWSAKQVVETPSGMADVARHHPQIVVIELGAHDQLRSHERAATKANLKRIINASRKMGAEVVLMEVPRAYMFDPYWGLEREIAREEDVELVPDTALRTILLHSPLLPPGSWRGPPYLTDEGGIHPNAAGNQILANSVAAALEHMYGPAVLRQGH
jgi:lysophospholipase L1-like esterase